MAKVHKTREFDKPADEVWGVIGDFHGMHKWVDGIEPSESLEGGTKRRFVMGGGQMVERLVEEGNRSYTYTIEEGALPVANYEATLSVKENGTDACIVDWVGTFEPAEGGTEESAVQIVEMVYEGGLAAMEKKFA